MQNVDGFKVNGLTLHDIIIILLNIYQNKANILDKNVNSRLCND